MLWVCGHSPDSSLHAAPSVLVLPTCLILLYNQAIQMDKTSVLVQQAINLNPDFNVVYLV